MKEALVLMAKAPREGEVKTRLLGALSPEEATRLYVAFLGDAFACMEDVKEEREWLTLALCYTPEGEEETFEEVEREGSLMIPQRGENLGERLTNCFADLFALGFESVVVVGVSDRVSSVGATVWCNLRAAFFAGPICAANPNTRASTA